jgi:putative Ca2+/H+ antiporter (TMEM165/GDT1 family)
MLKFFAGFDWKIFAVVFGTVFMAELGDKTQLATMLFATKRELSPMTIFLASAAALVVAAALGVLAGTYLAKYINARYLSFIAGVGFVAIGMWTLWAAWRGA